MQLGFDLEDEIRGVDADEDIGTGVEQLTDQRLAPTQEFPQATEYLDQPHDRQTFHGKFGHQPFGFHPRTAHAHEGDIRMLRTQRLHQTGAEQITRRLPCHQRHA